MSNPTEDLTNLLTDQARQGDEAVGRLARVESLVRSAERRHDGCVSTELLRRALDGQP